MLSDAMKFKEQFEKAKVIMEENFAKKGDKESGECKLSILQPENTTKFLDFINSDTKQ